MNAGYLDDTVTVESRNRFRWYRERVQKIEAARLFLRQDIPGLFQMFFSGGMIRMSAELPSEEEVMYAATLLRPFVQEKDAINHIDICGLLARKTTLPVLKDYSQEANREYQAIMTDPRIGGIAVYVDDKLLSPRRIFKLFVHSDGPHLLAAEKSELEGFGNYAILLRLLFTTMVVDLVRRPLRLMAFNVGIALGEEDLPEGGIAELPEERTRETVAQIRVGEYLTNKPYSELAEAEKVVSFHLFSREFPRPFYRDPEPPRQ